MSEILAKLSNAEVSLGGRTVLHGITINILRGEVLAVIGPNGAGKSTLLKVLAGITPLSHGALSLCDNNHRHRATWSRTVAYLPQTFMPHWRLTVRELAALGQRRGSALFGFAPARPATFDSIAALSLEPFANRIVQDLSGGERARAALAWALAGGAPLLAADEPIAALDPAQQIHTLNLLRQLRHQTASVVVLHNLNLALRYADRIAVLAAGRCVACARPSELVATGVLDQVFNLRFSRIVTSDGIFLAPETNQETSTIICQENTPNSLLKP